MKNLRAALDVSYGSFIHGALEFSSYDTLLVAHYAKKLLVMVFENSSTFSQQNLSKSSPRKKIRV